MRTRNSPKIDGLRNGIGQSNSPSPCGINRWHTQRASLEWRLALCVHDSWGVTQSESPAADPSPPRARASHSPATIPAAQSRTPSSPSARRGECIARRRTLQPTSRACVVRCTHARPTWLNHLVGSGVQRTAHATVRTPPDSASCIAFDLPLHKPNRQPPTRCHRGRVLPAHPRRFPPRHGGRLCPHPQPPLPFIFNFELCADRFVVGVDGT